MTIKKFMREFDALSPEDKKRVQLARLEVQPEGGQIRLRLTPKSEATLDRRAIERCLNFTFQQVETSDNK
jgi:hypothetical protein